MRTVGLVSVLVALAAVGWLSGTRSHQVARADAVQARAGQEAAAASNLASAEIALTAHRAETGSYAGATVSVPGIRVVRADAASFCVEGGGMHLARPGDGPAPGPC